MRLPRPLYYLLITTITELVLVSGAILVLLPTGFLQELPLRVFGFLLVYKTIIATIVLTIMARGRWQENSVIVKGGGILQGGFVGLLLGGILGGRYAGVFGAIVGIIGLYFLVSRIGAKISSAIAHQLDTLLSSKKETEPISIVRLARPTRLMVFMYAFVLPALLIVTAQLLNALAIPIHKYSETLPVARTVAIGLSLFSVLLPWLSRSRWMMRSTTSILSRENAIFMWGMASSVIPIVYGFFLFIAFGASMIELSLFAIASSLAAIIWSANTRIKQQNAG